MRYVGRGEGRQWRFSHRRTREPCTGKGYSSIPTHLLADSLSDIVEAVGVGSALKLLRQTTGPDAPISGQTFATVRYNAHSVSTVDDLTAVADSVVWVENTDRGRELSYRRTDRIEELR